MRSYARSLLAAILLVAPAIPLEAQQPAVTAADYARAERFLRENAAPLAFGVGVRPVWVSGDRFGYSNRIAGGSEFILVDPARGTRVVCSPETDRCGGAIDDRELARVRAMATRPTAAAEGASPDGKRVAFIREFNLWVRDVATGRETQLTTDGVKDFGYATDNAGWVRSDRPVLLWSPDSRKIATFQQDERTVGEMYLVDTKAGHPTLQSWKYPLPGDSTIAMLRRVVIDVDGRRVVPLDMAMDAHRSTLATRGLPWPGACVDGMLS